MLVNNFTCPQVLGSALLTNYADQDMLTILSKVAKVVATEYESNSSRTEFNNKKQIPFIYSTLTNKLFIQPKWFALFILFMIYN